MNTILSILEDKMYLYLNKPGIKRKNLGRWNSRISGVRWLQGWFVYHPYSYLSAYVVYHASSIFKLRTEAYTPTLNLLTDWLICLHNAPTNLTNWEKSYFYKVSGIKLTGHCSLDATPWEFNRRIFGWQQQQQV